AVQEFTIQTSVASARYGYASGVIEVSTKSGTNRLHGSLYEFLRNDKLDARNFFLAQKIKRKRNQYGFAGGGPVFIPKLYDGQSYLLVRQLRAAEGASRGCDDYLRSYRGSTSRGFFHSWPPDPGSAEQPELSGKRDPGQPPGSARSQFFQAIRAART